VKREGCRLLDYNANAFIDEANKVETHNYCHRKRQAQCNKRKEIKRRGYYRQKRKDAKGRRRKSNYESEGGMQRLHEVRWEQTDAKTYGKENHKAREQTGQRQSQQKTPNQE